MCFTLQTMANGSPDIIINPQFPATLTCMVNGAIGNSNSASSRGPEVSCSCLIIYSIHFSKFKPFRKHIYLVKCHQVNSIHKSEKLLTKYCVAYILGS